MKHPWISGAVLLATMLSACSFAPRKPFVPAAPPPNTGAVYFYRPSEMTGRLLKPTISANGGKLGRLANDSYGVAYLPPGPAQLRSVWPGIPGTARDDSATVVVEAGHAYYFRVRLRVNKAHDVTPTFSPVGALSFENRPGLEEVPENEATPQMAGMGPSDAFPAVRGGPPD